MSTPQSKRFGSISLVISAITVIYILVILLCIQLSSWESFAQIGQIVLSSILILGGIVGASLGIIFALVGGIQKENKKRCLAAFSLNITLISLMLTSYYFQFVFPLNKAKEEAVERQKQYIESLTIDDYLLLEIKGRPGDKVSSDLDKILKLIKEGANVNYIDKNGYTPLMKACSLKQVALVKLLIENKANPYYIFPKGNWSILHTAVRFSDLETVKFLLELGLDPNLRTSNEETPIHFIIYQSNERMLHLLIDKGADINAYNLQKDTCLHLMCYEFSARNHDKRLRILKILLDNKADTTIKNRNGETPLGSAKLRRLTKEIELLSQYE